MERNPIRNFCIIAHIDHGKSTMADRFLEMTGAISEREIKEQYLDRMDLERERGITIKAQAVKLAYQAENGREYLLNLIDTPGHVDFSYEVSRSLAACEGAVLLADAVQGVEAQTVGNAYLAMDAGLTIIPVVNKIDLPNADVARVTQELVEVIGCDHQDVIEASAKLGKGIKEILEAVVEKVPAPRGGEDSPLKALIFDSFYDSYRGVVALVRVVEGVIRKGMRVRLMAEDVSTEVEEVGVLTPDMQASMELEAGQVGYAITGIKKVDSVKVGDTLTDDAHPAERPLEGYKEPKPMVFAGLYPLNTYDYEDLRNALQKLKLNDASFTFEPETSKAMGFGFRCGFLGLLHMEIVRERLEREYDLALVSTAPNVVYEVELVSAKTVTIRSAGEMPDASKVKEIREPYIKATILVPSDYLGAIMDLVNERRGVFQDITYLTPNRVEVRYRMPLQELVLDFYDQLKSKSRGYASLDYEHIGFFKGNLVKLDILINGEPIDAFSTIVEKGKAFAYGKEMVNRLRGLIPRQLFDVPLQAVLGGRIIARETVKAKRKDVLAKCYGGDVTRKKKLLAKQKEGKKRMKMVGKVEIPQEAFFSAIKMREAGEKR